MSAPWHKASVCAVQGHVRSWGVKPTCRLNVKTSQFDPSPTSPRPQALTEPLPPNKVSWIVARFGGASLTGFLTNLRGRSQKFASADVSRFTSAPHGWSQRQLGHFNVGEKNAYPLSCPRDVCDHLRNQRRPGRG